MQEHLQTLIRLLQKNDLKALTQHYLNSDEVQNTAQLAFMFQQGEIKQSNFDYFQQLATAFIETKGLPNTVIAKIQTNSTLNFFTPALQLNNNFKQTDKHQRNVLHYLFTYHKVLSSAGQPPFNYLRSMMLFGSNNALREALCQRDEQNLTPIEAYLFNNKNLSPLALHELTAFLALVEVESKQQEIEPANYSRFIQLINPLFQEALSTSKDDLQRTVMLSTYYAKPIQNVIQDIKNKYDEII